MTSLRTIAAALVSTSLLVPFAAAQAQAKSPQLTAVLSQMDAASAKFVNAQADLRYDIYTRVVRDHSLQSGSLFVQRKGSTSTMGLAVFNIGADGKQIKPATNIAQFDGQLFRSYAPHDNQVNVFKAAGNQARYESFLTLGFGGSGKDLARQWAITDQGSEKLSDGSAQVMTEKLDLVSNDPDVKKMFTHVTVWIDPVRGISLRQIFYAPDGDTRTADYTNIRLNGKLDTKPYEIPKGVSVINH